MNAENGSPLVRFGRTLGAIIIIAAAPVSGYFLGQAFLTARASVNWPTVPGVLTQAKVRDPGIGGFHADVVYIYTVAGRQFAGTRIRASDGEHKQREGAEQALRGLAPGQQVTVHYDPADPGRSLLQTGAGFQEYAQLFVPVGMLSYGIYLLVSLRRSRRRGDSTQELTYHQQP
ncbi:DUF3592 domain-containing protein [Singulisphaera rosea]